MPDLALELALDILSDDHSEGLAHLVKPADENGADAYWDAFDAALRKKDGEIPADAVIQPTTGALDDRRSRRSTLRRTRFDTGKSVYKSVGDHGGLGRLHLARKLRVPSPSEVASCGQRKRAPLLS
ncbi:hypothetical protein B0H16DRAFT_1740061 [Mycena metata]|uniref:Uncharacterized protein n=1 Tax=Mycena metata TaxID=1033252 RepID=A0AAD7MI32_9AGAR|nr:hypothetical protein B0H16DRAFT_1740061 [Mycena metata]